MTQTLEANYSIPSYLSERIRLLNAHAPAARRNAFVLYWMHHAVRAHENPALDTAVWMGNQLGLPVLVYQGLAGRHPYNSDRHHTFIMEGARDVQQALAGRNIAYAFHLGVDPDEKSPLHALCSQAGLVIVEDYPAPPFPDWYRRRFDRSATGVWAVDAHCIVPMQSVGKAYDRAFKFREDTRGAFAQRLSQRWPAIDPEVEIFKGPLPFNTIDLQAASLPDLCAACDIDHSIGPVPHTRGGAEAGYQRWALFREYGLQQYAALRNDAAVAPPRGVSRLSPYLHHGHVSPFRIAREAAADGSAGARKFLDELLIWRELAFNFCFHHENVASLDVLPGWARQTLTKHAGDPREQLYTWDELAHAKTDDVLWNAAQRSLLIHGELHNNVRMTWGKSVLRWTQNPEAALAMLIDLNHRYALDGSDPNSYGGLLWCLGLFDRPFKPEQPVYGTVRTRPSEAHARRIDMEKYQNRVQKPARTRPLRIAIIGAGMAGLTAGNTLRHHGHEVVLFEKARGPGGRMATRRADAVAFDHGAQYFTARDGRFKRYVDAWCMQGLVAPWNGKIAVAEAGRLTERPIHTTRYVGVPRMSALTRRLSTELAINFNTRIERLTHDGDAWTLSSTDKSFSGFDAVVLTVPPEQAVPLLAEAPALAAKAAGIQILPCWAGMVAFEQPLDLPFDGIFINDAPLSWAARNGSKPGRDGKETWVLHATPEWSSKHLEAEKEAIAPRLTEAFFEATGGAPALPVHLQAHRWRYALPENPLDAGCLWDEETQIAVCGDWCQGARVEGAFLSGMAAAGRILGLPDETVNEAPGIQASLF